MGACQATGCEFESCGAQYIYTYFTSLLLFSFAFPMLKKITRTQRLLSDEKSSEAHRSISNSKYVSLIEPLVITSVRQDCKGKTMTTFPYNRIEDDEP